MPRRLQTFEIDHRRLAADVLDLEHLAGLGDDVPPLNMELPFGLERWLCKIIVTYASTEFITPRSAARDAAAQRAAKLPHSSVS
jgi:hypothetical protein